MQISSVSLRILEAPGQPAVPRVLYLRSRFNTMQPSMAPARRRPAWRRGAAAIPEAAPPWRPAPIIRRTPGGRLTPRRAQLIPSGLSVRMGSPFSGNAAAGPVAEWSCRGLQIPVHRFDSGPGLHLYPAPTQPTPRPPAARGAWPASVSSPASRMPFRPKRKAPRSRWLQGALQDRRGIPAAALFASVVGGQHRGFRRRRPHRVDQLTHGGQQAIGGEDLAVARGDQIVA